MSKDYESCRVCGSIAEDGIDICSYCLICDQEANLRPSIENAAKILAEEWDKMTVGEKIHHEILFEIQCFGFISSEKVDAIVNNYIQINE